MADLWVSKNFGKMYSFFKVIACTDLPLPFQSEWQYCWCSPVLSYSVERSHKWLCMFKIDRPCIWIKIEKDRNLQQTPAVWLGLECWLLPWGPKSDSLIWGSIEGLDLCSPVIASSWAHWWILDMGLCFSAIQRVLQNMFIMVSTSGQRWSLQAPAEPECGKQNPGHPWIWPDGVRIPGVCTYRSHHCDTEVCYPWAIPFKGQTVLNERLPDDDGQQNLYQELYLCAQSLPCQICLFQLSLQCQFVQNLGWYIVHSARPACLLLGEWAGMSKQVVYKGTPL